MIDDIFDRTRRLIGNEGLKRLRGARVLVFGLGGVGSYVCEGLARAGVGYLAIVDRDIVAISNINRQIIALNSTVGMRKTEAQAARLLDINPDLKIEKHFISFDKNTDSGIDFSCYDFVIDAIDSLPSKVLIAVKAKQAGVPLISSMGTGFRLDPNRLKIVDIFSTTGCPLARLMRKQLRAEGIDRLKVLFSDEAAEPSNTIDNTLEKNQQNIKNNVENCVDTIGINSQDSQKQSHEQSHEQGQEQKQKIIASISFVPSVAGLLIAGEVVREILKKQNEL